MRFELLFWAAAAILVALIVLPAVAIIRTRRIVHLEQRIAGLEAAVRRLMREGAPPAPARDEAPAAPAEAEAAPPVPAPHAPPERVSAAGPPPLSPEAHAPERQGLEEVIGRRWLSWVAVLLIFFATAFFLKHAFENRWIGEIGRVTMGVLAGLALIYGGWNRHRAGWEGFSRALTAGGVTLVYLSAYASFGFYQLLDQTTAFLFLVVIVVQAHLLAVVYNSRAIALMAQAGGFLVPVLLSTGRDNYPVLFTYLALLALGVVLVSAARDWRWVGSVSFAGVHTMFWLWYGEHYHPEKQAAALAFQLAVFVLFAAADYFPSWQGRLAGPERWSRILVNSLAFYSSAYHLLEDDYPGWMGVFALGLAVAYAALANAGLSREWRDRRTLLVTIGVSLTFVTVAIPVQLDANWVTLAWAAQGAALAWLSVRVDNSKLRVFAAAVFCLAVFHFLAFDTPWSFRPEFMPVFNRFFLSQLGLAALLLAGALSLWRREPKLGLAAGMTALAVFWAGITVETYTYSDALERALPPERSFAEVQAIRWRGQTTLSVLWSLYAAGLVAAGFRLALSSLRWAGLALFGLTVAKAFFVDMANLEGLYRVLAMLALGVLLLAVAWGYQRLVRGGEGAGEGAAQ